MEHSIKHHETSLALLDLQRSLYNLDFNLIVPGRRVLKSGILTKRGRKVDEERAFFLFSDIIVYADVSYGWNRTSADVSLPLASHAKHHDAARINLNDRVRRSSEASERPRLSVAFPSSFSITSQNNQYTYKRKLDLEYVTVNGSDGLTFEIRSPVKSFTVVARKWSGLSSVTKTGRPFVRTDQFDSYSHSGYQV